jgi:hypothetical protein
MKLKSVWKEVENTSFWELHRSENFIDNDLWWNTRNEIKIDQTNFGDTIWEDLKARFPLDK